MRPAERIFVYGALFLALAVGAGGWPHGSPTAGRAVAGTAGFGRVQSAPTPATVATCDIYYASDKLLESDRFAPAVQRQQEQFRETLKPFEDDLVSMRDRLQTMQPQDDDFQKLYREFQVKQQEFAQRRARLEQEYQAFVAQKYVEAYTMVKASVDAVAADLGYSHVVASRRKDDKIETTNVQRVVEAVLARPMLRAPDGCDITDDVLKDLKL